MTDSIEMPKYRSHKTVHALKIDFVRGNTVFPQDQRYAPIPVSNELFVRYQPICGDYLVVYEDGYQSFSPCRVFEEGYTEVTNG